MSAAYRRRVRRHAARTAYVLYRYFREAAPVEGIAEDAGLKLGTVDRIARGIAEHGAKLFSPGGCDCNVRRGHQCPSA